MAFDFNRDPLRLCSLWGNTTAPVQADYYGLCRSSCYYCFSNLNKLASEREPNLVNSGPQLFRALEREWANERSPIGWHMRSGHFVAASNTSDPFQRDEKQYRITEAFLKWAQQRKVAVLIQTKGNVLLEEWERYAPLLDPSRTVVYLSLSMLDDTIRRRLEPGALSVTGRLSLIERLTKVGVSVIAACNPYVPAWLPDVDEYCRIIHAAGAQHVYPFHLHLNPDQAEQIPAFYRAEVARANASTCQQEIGLRRWHEACEKERISFAMTHSHWDAAFDYPGEAIEDNWPAPCRGRMMHWQHDFYRALKRRSREAGNVPVVFNFTDLWQHLERAGVPNVELDVNPLRPALFLEGHAHKRFRYTVGRYAGLKDILRYCYNVPWECQKVVWSDPHTRLLSWRAEDKHEEDRHGDRIGVWIPGPLRQRGCGLEIDRDEFDFTRAVPLGDLQRGENHATASIPPPGLSLGAPAGGA